MVFIPDQVNKVIEQVQQVKRENQQFQLLPQMYAFMVDQNRIGFLAFVL